MDDFALTPAERALFQALTRRGVPFLIVGIGAAALQGAPLATQDLDLWFGDQPPAFGGAGLERIDVVLTVHGVEPFAAEYSRAIQQEVDGVALHVLPLDRVIASKRALNRAKDSAQLPALEATLLARDRSDSGSE